MAIVVGIIDHSAFTTFHYSLLKFLLARDYCEPAQTGFSKKTTKNPFVTPFDSINYTSGTQFITSGT